MVVMMMMMMMIRLALRISSGVQQGPGEGGSSKKLIPILNSGSHVSFCHNNQSACSVITIIIIIIENETMSLERSFSYRYPALSSYSLTTGYSSVQYTF